MYSFLPWFSYIKGGMFCPGFLVTGPHLLERSSYCCTFIWASLHVHIVGYSLHISSAQWTAKHGYQLHAQRAAVSKGNSRSGLVGWRINAFMANELLQKNHLNHKLTIPGKTTVNLLNNDTFIYIFWWCLSCSKPFEFSKFILPT